MPQKMLSFTKTGMEMPDKRPAEVRRADWQEVYGEYARAKAEEQSSRCSQCGIPFCQVHCPLHNNIPDWLKLTAEGRLEEAYEVSQATNTFPEICGRICPQDRLCEGSCVIEQSGHGTVTIGTIEKYITDTAWERGWVKPQAPSQERPESVGIIGAGPGGLAAADMLRQAGLQVTVYDRYDRAGGLMTYGIPGFKLEKDVSLERGESVQLGDYSLTYKGLSLSGLLDIRRGGDVFNMDLYYSTFYGTAEVTAQRGTPFTYDGFNVATGEMNDVEIIRDETYWMNEYSYVRENFVEDGSFIKLRELSLSYSLPRQLLGNFGAEGLTLTATGRNLWTRSDFSYGDPEGSLGGAGNGQGFYHMVTPGTKSYSLSLRLTM